MMETTAREQMLEYTARQLGIDPLEFRRKNMLHDVRPPVRVAGRQVIENVTPEESLEQAAAEIGYDAFRAEQARATAEGRYLGIGFAGYVEPQPSVAAYGNEPAHVRMHPTVTSTCSSVRARTARGSRRPPRSSPPSTSGRTSTTSPSTRATPKRRRSAPAPAGAAAAR